MKSLPIGTTLSVPAEHIFDLFGNEDGWSPMSAELNVWENTTEGLVAVECVNQEPGDSLLDRANHWQVTKTRKAQHNAEPSTN